MADNSFFEQVIADCGVSRRVKSWEVNPYRCRYHGELGAVAWQDRWKLNWLVTVGLNDPLPDKTVFAEGYETYAYVPGEPILDGPESMCLVIADFPDRDRAMAARSLLLEQGILGRVEVILVEDLFYQLQIEAGILPTSAFAGDIPIADEIEAICSRAGGWVSFNQRIDHLG